MADLNINPLATEQQILGTNPETSDLSRQRRIAEMLMAKGMQQPDGNMVSGYYVAPSWTQQLAPMLNAAMGVGLDKSLDEKQSKMAEALRKTGSEEVQSILELAKTDPKAALQRSITSNSQMGRSLTPQMSELALPKTPEEVAKYKYAQTPEGGGFKGSYTDFTNQMNEYQKAQIKNEEARTAIAAMTARNAGSENGMPKLSEFQGKATNFGVQMAGSVNEMKAVEDAGFNPGSRKNQAMLALAGTELGNNVVSPEVQRYKQGMDNFSESFIRFKSGANVPMSEIQKDLKNMMPKVGDSEDLLMQKQRARERALQGMSISAGPGAKFIAEAYNTPMPGMNNQKQAQQPTATQKQVPSLWGAATVVEK